MPSPVGGTSRGARLMGSLRGRRVAAAALALLVVAGCRTGRNYDDPASPRHVSTRATTDTSAVTGDTLLVVSFNIEYADEMARAIHALRRTPALRGADIVLLQEMDARGARMAADSLGMHHVYYPAIHNRVMRRDVGNAVLSRWPIVADAKLILPSRSRYAKTQRIATAATIRVRSRDVRVYSTHLGTPADLGHAGRVAQLRFIMADAERFAHVILGGDMNSTDVGEVAADAGYAWPTRAIPRSNVYGRIDHIFLLGLAPVDTHPAGTENLGPGVSDHRPIWTRAVFPP